MTSTFYTASFRHLDGTVQWSRTFQTKKAATRWTRFLLQLPYTKEVFLHRGQMGEMLLQHVCKS